VWLAGFPHDTQREAGTVLDDGLVVAAAHVVDDAGGTMRLDTPVTPGMSGGPVLDRSGRLAGLLYGEQSPTNDALVIPVSVLRTVIDAGLSAGSSC
jgi:S1-C subfamily serine protease